MSNTSMCQCPSILVCDDNVDAADTLALVLRVNGFEVREAYSGKKAIEIAEEMKPSMALLDIGLPDVDGYRVARAIRTHAWSSRTFIVAITGYGTAEDKQRAFNSGFDYHITKPMSPEHMRRLLEILEDKRGGNRVSPDATDELCG